MIMFAVPLVHEPEAAWLDGRVEVMHRCNSLVELLKLPLLQIILHFDIVEQCALILRLQYTSDVIVFDSAFGLHLLFGVACQVALSLDDGQQVLAAAICLASHDGIKALQLINRLPASNIDTILHLRYHAVIVEPVEMVDRHEGAFAFRVHLQRTIRI